MSKLPYSFIMPIGDWSDDGHGKCQNFKYTSNKPVEDVREAHFLIQEKTGIDISNVCSEYEDDLIKEDVLKRLEELGFDFKKAGFQMEDYPGPEGIAHVWAFLLQQADSSLQLKQDDYKADMLVFYGRDDKGRHVSGPGYGVFS